MKDKILLIPAGRDRNNRPIFVTPGGRYVVDVDYQRNPRRDLRTKYPATDGYYGEPDCHLAENLTPVFADTLVAAANDALESDGSCQRYVLRDGRLFRNNDVDSGDSFDELMPQTALPRLLALAGEAR